MYLAEHIHLASPTESAQVIYSMAKLRLSDDKLVNAVVNHLDNPELIFEMTPKDTALTAWALARYEIPHSNSVVSKLSSAIERNLTRAL